MFKKLFARLSSLLALGIFVGVFTLSTPITASAAPVDVLEKCDSQSRVCADRNDNKNTLPALLRNIINLLLTVIGIIAVIMIIIGGIRYTTSGGDAGETKTARDTLIYAVVGLVIAIMSFALVNFVVGRL